MSKPCDMTSLPGAAPEANASHVLSTPLPPEGPLSLLPRSFTSGRGASGACTAGTDQKAIG